MKNHHDYYMDLSLPRKRAHQLEPHCSPRPQDGTVIYSPKDLIKIIQDKSKTKFQGHRSLLWSLEILRNCLFKTSINKEEWEECPQGGWPLVSLCGWSDQVIRTEWVRLRLHKTDGCKPWSGDSKGMPTNTVCGVHMDTLMHTRVHERTKYTAALHKWIPYLPICCTFLS